MDGNIQIQLNVIDERNRRMTTVARQGNEELQRCGDVNDRGRWINQWYESCKHVWGGIRKQMAEAIQILGPHVHQDVLTRLNKDCGSFRGELETQLCWARDVQGDIVQGAQQFAQAVYSKLVQNDQSNDAQGGTIRELITSVRNSGG